MVRHDLAGLQAVAELQRDGPPARVGLVVQVEEPLLCEAQDRSSVARLHADDREAALEDPRVHDPADGLARGLFDGVPQVGGLGVAVLVVGHVLADPGAELLLAEVLLEHADDGGALLVGEDVEHPLGIRRRHDRVLDGPGRPQCVGVEGRRPGQPEADPPLPRRAVGVRDLAAP